jgi:hypothetical protein
MEPPFSVLRKIRISIRVKSDIKYLIGVFCFVVFAIPPHSFGTSIVLLSHNGTIWIAADSKESTSDGSATRNVCKIVNAGRFYWGAATQIYDDPRSGFTVKGLVDGIKSKKGTTYDLMNAFISEAKAPIIKEIKFIQRTDPVWFASTVEPIFARHESAVMFKVVFVGFRKGHPPEEVWTWITATREDGQIIIDGSPNKPKYAEGAAGLGLADEALTYITQHRARIATDTDALVRDSMAAEFSAEPLRKPFVHQMRRPRTVRTNRIVSR